MGKPTFRDHEQLLTVAGARIIMSNNWKNKFLTPPQGINKSGQQKNATKI